MYVHMFFKMISEGRQAETECGMFTRLQNYVKNRNRKPFYYKIAGEDYTIDEIKHGMLRGNAPKVGHIMRVLSSNDEKTKILPPVSKSISPFLIHLTGLLCSRFSGSKKTQESISSAWTSQISWSTFR